jgi:hypothetical protein
MQSKIMTKRQQTEALKYGTVEVFGNDSNKSKFDSGGN